MKQRTRILWLIALVLLLSLSFLGVGAADTQPPVQAHPLGDIPLDPETYQRYLQVYPDAMVEALPSTYDARTEGIVTSAKNQGSCGSCWAFASTGAMESHLLRAGLAFNPQDLAEQQLNSCDTSQSGCCGGSSSAIRYWETNGPVYETCWAYGDGSTSCPTNSNVPCSAGAGCEQLPYHVTGYHTVANSTDQFKTSLYNYGPSYWRYYVYSDFDTYWAYGNPGDVYVSKSGATLRGGHAVLLIGWDDAKAAFLCKNSWGANGGPNNDGTFWIAYSGHYYNLAFGMANFSVEGGVACYSDADCSDGESCTTDTCLSPGTPQAACQNTWAACGLSDGCCGPSCTANTDPDCACGNGICGGAAEGEDCTTCPADCPSGSGGGTCGACFKGKCDGTCNLAKEGPDCADCAPDWCCGDGTCGTGETYADCPVDCPLPVCGDGTCQAGETQCSCPGDCGNPPGTETNCSNGVDDDCDDDVDCLDSDCFAAPACICKAKGAVCSLNSECCSNKCRAGVCR